MSNPLRYPWFQSASLGRERGFYVWPCRGIMLGLLWRVASGRSTWQPRVKTLAAFGVMLLLVDVRPGKVAR